MSEELLNCPKCRKKPTLLDIDGHFYIVRCEHCKRMIQQLFNTRDEAISTWNAVINGDLEALVFKRCPVCHHAPLVTTDSKDVCMITYPKCSSQTFITNSPQNAQLLWNEYAKEVKE